MGKTIAVISASAQMESFFCYEICRVVNRLRFDDTYDVTGAGYRRFLKKKDIVVLDLPYFAQFDSELYQGQYASHSEYDIRYQLFKEAALIDELKQEKRILIGLLPNYTKVGKPRHPGLCSEQLKKRLDFVVRKGALDSHDLHKQFASIFNEIGK